MAKRLRVVEGVPATEAKPAARRLLGEIPLAGDGSFQVQVPANTPVQLQLVDADGLALRSSAWVWVRNHAAQGCVGCHEDPERTPPNRFMQALQAPAPLLNLPAEKRRTVSYAADVRPLVESRCLSCHAAAGREPRLDGVGPSRSGCGPGRPAAARSSGISWAGRPYGRGTRRPGPPLRSRCPPARGSPPPTSGRSSSGSTSEDSHEPHPRPRHPASRGRRRAGPGSRTAGARAEAADLQRGDGEGGHHLATELRRPRLSNIVEGTGSGACVFDYDGDGRLDVYFPNGRWERTVNDNRGRDQIGKLRNALYRNQGGFAFEDVTEKAGVGGKGFAFGCTAADLDDDGDLDLLVLVYGPDAFIRNNGDGTFTDVSGSPASPIRAGA